MMLYNWILYCTFFVCVGGGLLSRLVNIKFEILKGIEFLSSWNLTYSCFYNQAPGFATVCLLHLIRTYFIDALPRLSKQNIGFDSCFWIHVNILSLIRYSFLFIYYLNKSSSISQLMISSKLCLQNISSQLYCLHVSDKQLLRSC